MVSFLAMKQGIVDQFHFTDQSILPMNGRLTCKRVLLCHLHGKTKYLATESWLIYRFVFIIQ